MMSGMGLSRRKCLLLLVSLFNISLWYLVGKWQSTHQRYLSCGGETHQEYSTSNCISTQHFEQQASSVCGTKIIGELPRFRPLLTRGFVRYKADSLVNFRYPEWSILMQPQNTPKCNIIVNPHVSRKRQFGCLGVVTVNAESTYNLLRFDKNLVDAAQAPHEDTALLNVTGFFNNVANDNGRRKLAEKLGKLLEGLDSLEQYVLSTLAKRSLFPGQSDVAVMVVNDGEIDLFANFACSCRSHNISMHNVLVFAGSEEVLPLIESMGAMALYHKETFASVSRSASYEYLDPIFIDMMWYKAFSVWLLLKLKFNVLFQDVDLVWYRDPVQYFRRASGSSNSGGSSGSSSSGGVLDSAAVVVNRLSSAVLGLHWQRNDAPASTHINGDTVTSSSSGSRNSSGDSDSSSDGSSSSSSRIQRQLSITSPTSSQQQQQQQQKQQKQQQQQQHHQRIISSVHHDSWGNRLLSLPPADAYLSDDGQRSLRYTPFFANSGFYYLVANAKTENFAWGIVTAFDLLHRTGSHQNVFTIRLIESLDLGDIRPKLLSLREFPAGVKFHHDKPYMRAIKDGHEHPFVFHMCWTRNKYDKLRYFREASMWFVREDVSAQLGELGISKDKMGAEELRNDAQLLHMKGVPIQERWDLMSKRICAAAGSGSP